MCKVYGRLYACGHFKPDYRLCRQVDRPRLVNVMMCPREAPGVTDLFHYDCSECTADGMELEQKELAPLPAPVVRRASPASLRETGPAGRLPVREVSETSSWRLEGYDENVPVLNGPRAPAWEDRRSTLEDLDQDAILAKLRPGTTAGRKGTRGDTAHVREQRPSQRQPEPAGALPQGKSLRRSQRSADLKAEASRGASDGPTVVRRSESLRAVAKEPSRPHADREKLPSYKYVWNYGVRPSDADKRRKGQASKKGEHPATKTQASSRHAPATREESRGGEVQGQAPRPPPHSTPLPARLEPLGTHDPSAMPAPLRTSRRRVRRRGKELQKMETIPEVDAPEPPAASRPGNPKFAAVRADDPRILAPQSRRKGSNTGDSDKSGTGSVREAVAVRPGAAKLRARRVEVTGPRALRATREVLARV